MAGIATAQTSQPSAGNPMFASPLSGATGFFTDPARADQDIVFGGGLELAVRGETINQRQTNADFRRASLDNAELSLYANFYRLFGLNAVVIGEPVRERDGSTFFKDTGVYVDQLYGSLDLDPLLLYGGKIHPRFGLAWDLAPGLYGPDFAENYEITEKQGVGAAVRLPFISNGRHQLSFEMFRADTSFLSNSGLTRPRIDDSRTLRPGRLAFEDGGLANRDGLQSYGVGVFGQNVHVGDPSRFGSITYAAHFVRQAPGATETTDERRAGIGAQWEIPIAPRFTLTPLVEVVKRWGFGGQPGQATDLHASAELGYYAWRGSIAAHWLSAHGTNATHDWLYTASVGYDLFRATGIRGLGVDAAVREAREGGVLSTAVGIEVNYLIRF